MDSLAKLINALTNLIKALTPAKTSTMFFRIFITILICVVMYGVFNKKHDKSEVFEKSSKISYVINSELERIRIKNSANYCAVYIAHNGKEMLDGKGMYYLDQIFYSDCLTCKYESNLMQNLPASQFSFTIQVLKNIPYIYVKSLEKPVIGYRSEPAEFYRLRRMIESYGTKSLAVGGIFAYKYNMIGWEDGWFKFFYMKKVLLGFMTLEFTEETNLSNNDLKMFESDIRFIEAKINQLE